MAHKHVSIPAALVPEFEAWGEMTARLFGELRRQIGMKPVKLVKIPDDQVWFWTDEHQAKERLVDEEFKQGAYDVFERADDLINDLHAHV